MSNHRRYYAVRIGRNGPQLYDSYADFAQATHGFSGSSGKGFDNIRDAQAWLAGYQFGPTTMTHTRTDISLTLNLSGRVDGLHSESRVASTSTSSTTATHLSEHSRRYQEWRANDIPLDQQKLRAFNMPQHAVGESVGLAPQQQGEQNPPPHPPDPEVELSEEQKNILDMVKDGKNIFFTGPAGTGKSVLLRAIIRYLLAVYGIEYIAVTAPTGIAGLNIRGQTIHSWAGIRLGKEPVEDLVKNIGRNARKRWLTVRALIIDEISMVDGRLFDKLEAIARAMRETDAPFGGIQLLLSGDFFQLPPVPDQDSTTSIASTFAFEARSWPRCVDYRVALSRVFRQKDKKFIEMLSAMRTGHLQDWHIEEFQKLSRAVVYADGISPTEIFPLKSQVEQCNRARLRELPGDTLVYTAMDSRGRDIYNDRVDVKSAEQLLDKLVVAKEVSLKVGAQVMLLRNVVQGRLVNGSLGKVIEFITTHEAQERHIEIAEMESKSRNANTCAPVVYDPAGGEDQPGLIALDRNTFDKRQLFPLVKFTNGLSLLCTPTEFTVEGLKGNMEARRIQVPLALAWAMSIHKAQGQTLTRVKVDLRRIFEKGQAYVALSRATSMEGLEIANFTPEKVMAHPRVLEWQSQWEEQTRSEMDMEEMDMPEAVEQYHSFSC